MIKLTAGQQLQLQRYTNRRCAEIGRNKRREAEIRAITQTVKGTGNANNR